MTLEEAGEAFEEAIERLSQGNYKGPSIHIYVDEDRCIVLSMGHVMMTWNPLSCKYWVDVEIFLESLKTLFIKMLPADEVELLKRDSFYEAGNQLMIFVLTKEWWKCMHEGE